MKGCTCLGMKGRMPPLHIWCQIFFWGGTLQDLLPKMLGIPQLCTPPHYMRNARTTNGTLICNAPEIATCCGEAAPVQPHHHSLPKFQVTKIAFLPLGSHTFQAIWHKVWDWPSTGSSTVSKDYCIYVLTPWLHFHILSYTRWFLKLDSCSTWFGCPSCHPGLNVPSPALVKSI